MIRHSVRTGLTCSTSPIQREVIQAQGHTGSNQNCTSSRSPGCPATPAPTAARARVFRRSRPDLAGIGNRHSGLHTSLATTVQRTSGQLYAGLDGGDLAVAHRVLAEITKRASELRQNL
jgi:hypothetical protein